MIRLVVFLGNPESRFKNTRHNAAFMLLDAFPAAQNLPWKTKFRGQIACCGPPVPGLRLLRPETSMNLSGKSVAAAMDFFAIKPTELLAAHDDVELGFGDLACRLGGGLAGHNGLRSIRDCIGTAEFNRLRIGIGRPPKGPLKSWVLGRFDPHQEAALPEILENASRLLADALAAGRGVSSN